MKILRVFCYFVLQSLRSTHQPLSVLSWFIA